MAWYTLANRHVATAWYNILVNTRGLEYLVTYVTDTFGVRHASTTIKRKYELKGRAHTSCISVTVRVAL